MEPWLVIVIRVAVTIVIALAARFIIRRAIKKAVKSSSLKRVQQANENLEGAAAKAGGRKHRQRAAAVMVASGASPEQRAANRADTLGRWLCLLVDWIIGVVLVLTVMNECGLSLTPLLTSAGITGVIFGIGAQSMIKDLLAGMFMVFEGQYGVGDTIDVGGVRGVVQEIGTRVTRLQGADGEVWYVRNGEVTTLGNRSQGWVTSTVELSVPAGRDPGQVLETLRAVAEQLDADPEWHDQLLRPPVVVGLTSADTTKMTFTIKVSCPQQSPVEFELRARALTALAQV